MMELYIVVYGHDFKYSTEKSTFADSETDFPIPNFVFEYYIIRENENYYLVDTGFNSLSKACNYGIIFNDVSSELREIIDGYKLAGIFITHDHFDHTGNLALYQNTTIYINKLEMAEMIKDEYKKTILSKNKVIQFVDEINVNENMRIKYIGGHTVGSSVVYLNCRNKEYLIVGDECYSKRNIDEIRPIGNYYSKGKNIAFIQEIRKENCEVLINHDGTMLNRYEKISEYIYRVV